MSVPQRRSLYDCLNDRLRADARLGLARNSAAMAGGAAGPLLHRDGREYVSFMSNDGLGLAADAHWQARVTACFAAHAPSASASRLAGGRSDVVDQACRAVADYFGFAECLFLPSGYQANLACVTTLLQQGQEAFVDRRCHASVMRALPLAGARIRAWNHLDYDHLSGAQHIFDLALLLKYGAYLYMRIDPFLVGVRVEPPDELVERVEIQAQIQIMHECLLLVPYVHKGSVEGRKKFLHLAEIYIPHRKTVPLAGLLVELDKPVILHQCYRDFRRIDIYNKILDRFIH